LNNLVQQQQQQQQENGSELDSDEVLKEFAFLNNEDNETSSSSDSESCGSSTNGDDWNIDRKTLTRLTEEYKKERKLKSAKANGQQQSLANTNQQQQQQQQQVSYSSVRPSRSSLQAMIANLNEVTNDSSNEETKNNDETLDSSLNLGDLSSISVNDETVVETNNDNNNKIDLNLSLNSSTRHTLVNKYSLKGHFDSIRCVTFHPIDSLVLSGSEDQTIKLWNLDKFALINTQSSKKNAQNSDYEPIYTYRGHSAAILDLLMCSNGTQFFSSSLDSTIKLWNLPSSCDQIDPYDVYNSNIYVKSLIGHTDAVWSICLNGDTLVSASSDRSLSIWKPFNQIDDPRLATIQLDHKPTSITFNSQNSQQLITSFDRYTHQIFDIETCKSIIDLKSDNSQDNHVSHTYKILSHPTNSLILSAHEDKSIRFYDSSSGKLVHKMIAHQDACTNLAIDPSHTYLLSSSHDCSIRLWSLDTKNCIQEITAHRKKNDESVHCIAYHETKSYIASGAADALLKIYV
jgi:striatin 1/3/4